MMFKVVRRKSNDIQNSQVFRLAIQVEQINIDRNSFFFVGKHKNSSKSSIQHLLQHVQIQDRSTSFETNLKSSMANLSRPRHHTIYKDKTSSDELSKKSFLFGETRTVFQDSKCVSKLLLARLLTHGKQSPPRHRAS